MAKGYSLHIGLNAVDPRHYQGWSGELLACEFDANDMALIAQTKGVAPKQLLTKAATRKAVSELLVAAAKEASAGDFFFLTYSGHGGQIPDLNGDEDDAADETWCLFDGEMLDDEIFAHLGKFRQGVRIFVLSDSCHSGTVLKNARLTEQLGQGAAAERARAMPPEFAQRTYLANKEFYDKLGAMKKNGLAKQDVAASALLVSGCQDNQFSSDGMFNGLFTGKLKQVWNGGKFEGSYRKFFKAIRRIMPADQTPNYFWAGEPDRDFEGEDPFTV